MDEIRYREAIERTMNHNLTKEEKLSMLVIGWIAEVGETIDIIKKHLYHGHELDVEKVINEMGDSEWYRNHLMKQLNIDPDIVRINNIMKLKNRYKDSFSEEESINREL